MYMVMQHSLAEPAFYLLVLLATAVALLPDLVIGLGRGIVDPPDWLIWARQCRTGPRPLQGPRSLRDRVASGDEGDDAEGELAASADRAALIHAIELQRDPESR